MTQDTEHGIKKKKSSKLRLNHTSGLEPGTLRYRPFRRGNSCHWSSCLKHLEAQRNGKFKLLVLWFPALRVPARVRRDHERRRCPWVQQSLLEATWVGTRTGLCQRDERKSGASWGLGRGTAHRLSVIKHVPFPSSSRASVSQGWLSGLKATGSHELLHSAMEEHGSMEAAFPPC